MRIYFIKPAFAFFAALSTIAFANAQQLKDALVFYHDCESNATNSKDVKISDSIKISEGKFGKGLVFERRTVNLVPNGDFARNDFEKWVKPDNAQWLEKGGINDSSCLKIGNGSPLALPLLDLKPGSPFAVSFYAKRAADSEAAVNVEVACNGKTEKLVADKKLTADFDRITASFEPSADSAVLRIYAQGEILLDNMQLDAGINYSNSFSEPLKMRGCDMIQFPPDGKYLNPASGSLAVWMKLPWLGKDSKFENSNIILNARDNNVKSEKWHDHIALSIGAYCPAGKDAKKYFYISATDAAKRQHSLSMNFEEIKDTADGWHLFAFNWKAEGDLLKFDIYVDGVQQHVSKSTAWGPALKSTETSFGYGGGGYINGSVDDIALFNRPLGDDEVKLISEAKKSLSELIK